MKAVAVTKREGGNWRDFEVCRDYWGRPSEGKLGCGGVVHSIKFDNGLIWDTVNGWRKNTFPRIRVKSGRRVI